MNTTVYVCSKCGRECLDAVERSDWLISRRRSGRGWIIRCPDCVNEYAVRQAERYSEWHKFLAKSLRRGER